MAAKERRDPFAILGVGPDADDDAIKTAYRRLAMHLHPDRAGESRRQEFEDLKWAYDRLKDPASRTRPGDGVVHETARPASIATAFDSFFETVETHGRGRATPPPRAKAAPGSVVRLEITLEEAFKGGRFHLAREGGSCETCKGRGKVRTERPQPCSRCGGSGSIRAVRGIISVSNECHACQGTGRTNSCACPECAGRGGGDGIDAAVDIPAGCRDGFKLSVPGSDGVQVQVSVLPHPVFERVKVEHLHAELRIPVWAAVLGHRAVIKGVDGEPMVVIVEPGSWTGNAIVFEGRGMPAFPGRGDATVELIVERPEASDANLALMKRMRSLDLGEQP